MITAMVWVTFVAGALVALGLVALCAVLWALEDPRALDAEARAPRGWKG